MKIKHIMFTALAGGLLTTGCSPEEYSLAAIDVTTTQLSEGEGFSVQVDQTTNYVTCTSNLSGKTIYWEYGPKPADGEAFSVSGNYVGQSYKVGIAFPGEYYVRMAADNAGGLAFGEPAYFTIDKINTDLISDPSWVTLTGGVGQSKTWVLDLDPETGAALKFGGPKWFFTSGQNWDSFHNAAGANYIDANPWDASTAIDPTHSADWYWAADYAGNGWICGLSDYGEMTFDLINGANVDVNGSKGTFSMDVEAHTISFTGVLPLSCGAESSIATLCPAGTYKIIYLSDNAMQILFDGGPSAETPFSMNYISKEYKDNYVAPVVTDITLPEDWMDYIVPKTQHNTVYKFNSDAPCTWFDVTGTSELKRSYTAADVSDYKFAFYWPNNTLTITNPNGDETAITYTLDEKGNYTFDAALPIFDLATDNADILFGASDNQLQILSYEVDDYSGDLTELVLGARQYDAQGNFYEYVAYRLVKQTGSAEPERFKVSLGLADTGWTFITHEDCYITGEGTYTFSLKPDGACQTDQPYLYFIDVAKLLKKYPNADLTLTSIKVDGVEVLGANENMTDEAIARCVGDDPTTGRRYLLNPWDETSAANTSLFAFTTSLDVTMQVTYDAGEVKLK
ncbi:MAG: hypothetical protein K6E73_02435 [Bacteroidales bacterium]|nr:hypothetical protein [Bacteroidales bacterium]